MPFGVAGVTTGRPERGADVHSQLALHCIAFRHHMAALGSTMDGRRRGNPSRDILHDSAMTFRRLELNGVKVPYFAAAH
jgi:hypothetical protein